MRTKKEIKGLHQSMTSLWGCIEDTRKMIYRLAEATGYEFYDKYYPGIKSDLDLVRRKK
ncbi:MAG: hypothetical protein Q8M94_08160 [Ignavibacteria bacterium]|nr:hypothetical protein [Ignavibacteria bacterium]